MANVSLVWKTLDQYGPNTLFMINTTENTQAVQCHLSLEKERNQLSTMPAMLILLLNYVIFLTPTNIKTVAAVSKCEKIDTTLLPNCQKIGYNFTANFSYVGLQNYQALVSTEVVRFSDRFRNCSRHAEALVCGRYVPKCSENVEGPVHPCREVCEQFVDDCANLLTNNGLYYQYVAYCRLLSSEMESSKQCFKPLGFVPRANLTTGELNMIIPPWRNLINCGLNEINL